MVFNGKQTLLFLAFLTCSSFSYAQVDNLSPQAYASFSAGYGNFQHTSDNTSDSAIGRVAIGSSWYPHTNVSLGAEMGVQSGNRMLLSNDVAAALGYTSTLPIYLTVKPPVDLLAALKLHFNKPLFVQVKAGAVYLRTTTDSPDIQSQSQLLPEAQVGIGYDLTCRTRFVLSYQRFFGKSPTLTNIDSATGTANLRHIPSWQAGMLSFETDL